MFHCAVVSSSNIFQQPFQLCFTEVLHQNFPANLFSCAKLKQLFRKYPMMIQRRSETHGTFPCQYDLICPDDDVWHNGAVALRYDLSYWQSAFCYTIWYIQTATFGLWLVLHYDTIYPTSSQLFPIRSDLSKLRPSWCITIRFVLLLETGFNYDLICPDSCETCL